MNKLVEIYNRLLEIFRKAWGVIYILVIIFGVLILFIPCGVAVFLKKSKNKNDGVIDIE